jgi:hypothetical protein
MSRPFSVTLKSANVKQVTAELAKLGPKHSRAVQRRALRAAANTLLDRFRFTVPVDSGATKKALGQVEQTNSTFTTHSVFVGVRRAYEMAVSKKRTVKLLKGGHTLYGTTNKKGKDIYVKRPREYAYIAERRSKKNKNWFRDTYMANGTRFTMIKSFVDELMPQIQIQLQKIKAAAAKRAAA